MHRKAYTWESNETIELKIRDETEFLEMKPHMGSDLQKGRIYFIPYVATLVLFADHLPHATYILQGVRFIKYIQISYDMRRSS